MRFRFGIRMKLIGIMNAILVVAAIAIVGFSTQLFSKDNVARVQESNLETARLIAQEVQNDFTNLTEKMRLLGLTLLQPLTQGQLETLQKPFFEAEKDLLIESVWTLTDGQPKLLGTSGNDAVLKTLDLGREDVSKVQDKIDRAKIFASQESIQSDDIQGKIPVVTLTLPLLTDEKGAVTHSVVATLRQDRFLKAVSNSGMTVSFLVDSKGDLLAHPDQARVLKRENLSHLEIVKQMLSGKTNNGQTKYVDAETQISYLGAFKTVGFAGIGVVAEVDEMKALEAAKKVRNTSVIITGMVAVVAFVIVFFFSLSLTNPILALVDATAEISAGRYEIELKKGANDEIGDLTTSFGQMATGLAEREKIKNAFSKFHSKDVADKILAGELTLAGERKQVTIFFSDIRSFTSISEKLEPEQVVELVNSYMTRMVRIIFAHGGVVDKYVGDAIMAVYGTPVSYGNDSLRAVSAALRMREELKRYNQDQERMGKPVIAIGMGMNTGFVVAGNIGSPERMEYTVLGDNVNLTSRMESLTKEFHTDILISQSTYEEIKDQIHCEARGTTKVKGKADEVMVYEVMAFKPGCEYIPPETGHTGETTFAKTGNTGQMVVQRGPKPTMLPNQKPAPAAKVTSVAPVAHAAPVTPTASFAAPVAQERTATEIKFEMPAELEVPVAAIAPPKPAAPVAAVAPVAQAAPAHPAPRAAPVAAPVAAAPVMAEAVQDSGPVEIQVVLEAAPDDSEAA